MAGVTKERRIQRKPIDMNVVQVARNKVADNIQKTSLPDKTKKALLNSIVTKGAVSVSENLKKAISNYDLNTRTKIQRALAKNREKTQRTRTMIRLNVAANPGVVRLTKKLYELTRKKRNSGLSPDETRVHKVLGNFSRQMGLAKTKENVNTLVTQMSKKIEAIPKRSEVGGQKGKNLQRNERKKYK